MSIAGRDARLVTEALLAEADWSPTTFEGYANERTERMRRLRATAETVTRLPCGFSPDEHNDAPRPSVGSLPTRRPGCRSPPDSWARTTCPAGVHPRGCGCLLALP